MTSSWHIERYKVGTSENGRRNMLKRMNIINPTQQQKEEAEKKAIEEHHVVLFMLGANKYKYGKLLEDLKNNIGRIKIHFQKLSQKSKWKNHQRGKYDDNKSESNDGIALATMMQEKETTKSDKKKEITCFRSQKTGHYWNECEEELPQTANEKKGTILLVVKEDSSDKELASEDGYNSEEDIRMTQEDQPVDDQDKKNTADDKSYEYDGMFSKADYERFAFVQDVTWQHE